MTMEGYSHLVALVLFIFVVVVLCVYKSAERPRSTFPVRFIMSSAEANQRQKVYKHDRDYRRSRPCCMRWASATRSLFTPMT